MGSLSPNPTAKSGAPGSAEDLAKGMVAVCEVVLTRYRMPAYHREGVDIARGTLDAGELAAIKNRVPNVLASLNAARIAAHTAYAGSNTMHGARQYRTRYNGDITTNLGRTARNPGTPLSAHFGPFLNSTGGTAVEVIAP
jgi:hypothetical protein